MGSQSMNLIVDKNQFSEWICINDTIMGGSSQAGCVVSQEGLVLRGEVIEEGGGFVSCCSPKIEPPLDLSKFQGFRIALDGDGRNFKFAVATSNRSSGFAERFLGSIRWVAEIPTSESGTTFSDIFFRDLKPAVRAKSIPFPLKFDSSKDSFGKS